MIAQGKLLASVFNKCSFTKFSLSDAPLTKAYRQPHVNTINSIESFVSQIPQNILEKDDNLDGLLHLQHLIGRLLLSNAIVLPNLYDFLLGFHCLRSTMD